MTSDPLSSFEEDEGELDRTFEAERLVTTHGTRVFGEQHRPRRCAAAGVEQLRPHRVLGVAAPAQRRWRVDATQLHDVRQRRVERRQRDDLPAGDRDPAALGLELTIQKLRAARAGLLVVVVRAEPSASSS